MDKYTNAFKYMHTKKNGSLPSLNNILDKINKLDYKTVDSFETAILRVKAGTCDPKKYTFSEKYCAENPIAMKAWYLEQKDYSRAGVANFEKKADLFKDIIIRENFEFFNVVYNDWIKDYKLSALKDIGA